MNNTMVETALAYVAQGFKVFPVKPDKKPLTKHGLKDATQTQSGVRDYWSRWPDAGIAIVTAGYVVLDIDTNKGGLKSKASIEERYGPLPRTRTHHTGGGGLHYIYRNPDGKNIRNAVMLGGYQGIDLRANGGYIVVPPSRHESGHYYRLLDDSEIAPAPAWLMELATKKRNSPGQTTEDTPSIARGKRNATLASLAGTMRCRGMPEEAIEAALLEVNRRQCSPPLAETDVRQVAQSIALYEPVFQLGQSASTVASGILNLTDVGNAERLVAEYGRDIRFNVITKNWHVWDGRCWQLDIGEIRLRQLAKATVRNIYAEAANEPDDKQRERIVSHARRSESDRAIAAMISLAQAERDIATTPNDFDRDPWLLNLPNGTLNLKTGLLQQHNRDDMLTRIATVEYDPGAFCPQWQSFLTRIFNGNNDLISYVQRALGYSMTGDTGERVLFFCYGTGANGKTQLLTAVRSVLGPYAGQTSPATFVVQKNQNQTGPNEAIAALHNVHLVTATETEGTQRLAVALLKQATGGEDLWHEKKWQHGFSFKPRFKLWLSGNYEPIITDNTDSIWDRLNKIPFVSRIPKQEQIRDYGLWLAREHGSAILTWLVNGCQDWLKQGLRPPSEVINATQAYRDSQDILREFLAEECVLDPDAATITVADLYKHYQSWCAENGSFCLGKITFNTKLREKELVTFRGARNKETWRGIRLLDAQERLLVTSSTPEVTSIPRNTTSHAYARELSGTEVTEVTPQAQNKAVTSAEKRGLQVTSYGKYSDPWDGFLEEDESQQSG